MLARAIIKREVNDAEDVMRFSENKASINTLNSTSVDESHERNSFALRSNKNLLHHMLKSGAAISRISLNSSWQFDAIKKVLLMFSQNILHSSCSICMHIDSCVKILKTRLSNDEKLTFFPRKKIKTHVKNVWSGIFQSKIF